ncbi:SH3 domain-containing protein [Planctomycetota bacterium]
MKYHFSLSVFIILLALSSALQAQETADSETNVRSFPYIAEIIGDDVYIRSGPGTNYYDCGKLKQADRVKVVGTQYGWSRIVPPVGSFSWISKQYVEIDPDDPAKGVVTGDAVRVYAGSDHVKPLYSTTLQGKLDRQDKVQLLGEEKGGYHKIAPPAFAYLWVSSKYTKPIDLPEATLLTTEKEAEPQEKPPAVIISEKPAPEEKPTLAEKLQEYYTLQEKIRLEQTKPLQEQNYIDMKKALLAIANDKNAGKAARYAQFSLGRIERFQLALSVDKYLQLQDNKLQNIKKQIDVARNTKLNQTPDLGKFDVIGMLQTSGVYSSEKQQRHFRLVDKSGKTICYALPTGTAEGMDLGVFVGTRVGLTGKILPHPQTSGALIEFADIQKLN